MSDSVSKYFEMLESSGYVSDRTDGISNDKDPIVEAIKFEFDQRSRLGQQKYGTTLAESDADFLEWLQHAKEEAMDFALYCQKMIVLLKNKRYDEGKQNN